MHRDDLLVELANKLNQLQTSHPLCVGIDGIDAAGKTTFANDLEIKIQELDRPVIRASLDGFHQPRHIRYAEGNLSPLGYFQDSFDIPSFKKNLLDPLSSSGNRYIRTAIYDHQKEEKVERISFQVPERAILLCDGIFLQRPELVEGWDVTIFLHISFETSLERALIRDLPFLKSTEVIEKRYRDRYIPAQKKYLLDYQPDQNAAILINLEDPTNPILLRNI